MTIASPPVHKGLYLCLAETFQGKILDKGHMALYIRGTLEGALMEIHVFPARTPSHRSDLSLIPWTPGEKKRGQKEKGTG